ncbi:MAG: hypothetical protein KC492_10935 [Myxococcales bacterium]|nr:hypothetical protein [Myxococcales bacterium]
MEGRRLGWLLLLWLLCPAAEAARIALLIDEFPPAYQRVVDDVAASIGGTLRVSQSDWVTLRDIGSDTAPSAVSDWLRSAKPEAIIALGAVSAERCAELAPSTPCLVSAVAGPPLGHAAGLPGVSFISSARAALETLRLLDIEVKRIWTVYQPSEDQWLIDDARRHLAVGVELHAITVDDLKLATRQLAQALARSEVGDAVWLPANPRLVSARYTLPFLIDESWKRRVPIVSSTLSHVRLGVLAATFPDPKALGERLAQQAARLAHGAAVPSQLMPLEDVQRALNMRTARHLGLSLSEGVLRQFVLKFPLEGTP